MAKKSSGPMTFTAVASALAERGAAALDRYRGVLARALAGEATPAELATAASAAGRHPQQVQDDLEGEESRRKAIEASKDHQALGAACKAAAVAITNQVVARRRAIEELDATDRRLERERGAAVAMASVAGRALEKVRKLVPLWIKQRRSQARGLLSSLESQLRVARSDVFAGQQAVAALKLTVVEGHTLAEAAKSRDEHAAKTHASLVEAEGRLARLTSEVSGALALVEAAEKLEADEFARALDPSQPYVPTPNPDDFEQAAA